MCNQDVAIKISELLALSFSNSNCKEEVVLKLISTPEEYHAVLDLRKKCYSRKSSHLINEFNSEFQDEYDAQSNIYAVFLKNSNLAIATLRATKYPFKSLTYINEKDLASLLKLKNTIFLKTKVIEFGRLIMDGGYCKQLEIKKSLMFFSGIHTSLTTNAEYYIGYTQSNSRNLVFSQDVKTTSINIPGRKFNYKFAVGELNKELIRNLSKKIENKDIMH